MVPGAFLDGIRRVAAAWKLLVVLLLAASGLALPVALATGSPAPETGTAGVGAAGTAGALVVTSHSLGPDPYELVFIASSFALANGPSQAAVVGPALAAFLVWTFLTGGAVDRLARQRWMGSAGFLAACRHHFWPLTRLAVLAGVLYWLLWIALHSWLGDVPDASARGPRSGASTDAVRLALHGLLGAVGAAVGLLVDYARVRAVVEDRRSMIGALVAAFRFAARRPAAVAGLWLLNLVLLALLLAGCSLLAQPAIGVGRSGPFLAGQVYAAAHLVATLVAWGSQTAYFQGQLAHPTYVARARVPRTG